ncbi:MAG: sigma-70 family RNA polymerase sigma factor [Clostridiales Family XIII bacterium]|nr:sigma-70 family RNA polymerase sigma factor [Clostridiales Family XIII bacterium]
MSQKDKDISRLVIQAQKGSVDAFEELYHIFTPSILYHVKNLLISREEVEDAAQDVVLEMYKNIGSLKSAYAFSAWLHQIITGVCYARNRKTQRTDAPADIDDYTDVLTEDDKDSLPEKASLERDREDIVMAIIDGLSKSQKRAVVMYYYEGMSYKEIAKALGVTTSTVSTNIVKAKNMIKREAEKLKPLMAAAIAKDIGSQFPAEKIQNFCVKTDSLVKETAAHSPVAVHVSAAGKAAVAWKLGATAIGAAAVISALILVPPNGTDIGDKESPAVTAPAQDVQTDIPAAAPAPIVYEPDAAISLEGGISPDGHVNPEAAELIIDSRDGVAADWRIVPQKSEEEVAAGSGSRITDELKALRPGEYTIYWQVSGNNGGAATVSRAIEVV